MTSGEERRASSERSRLLLELEVIRDLTLATDEPAGLDATLSRSLEKICRATDWDLAQAWLPDAQGVLICRADWHEGGPATSFADVSRKLSLPPGKGLPGTVWMGGRASWISPISAADDFLRRSAADAAGLRAGMAVLVVAAGEAAAVLEFFAHRQREEEDWVTGLMVSVASQLGSLIRRKRTEEALRESESRFRSVAETAPDGIVSGDCSGRIVYLNAAAERMFGYAADDVVGAPLTLLMPDGIDTQPSTRASPDGQKRLTNRTLALTGRRADGSHFPLELSLGSWKRFEETFSTGIIRDVSGREQIERENRRLEEQLQDARRLETVGRLAGGIAHDFNNLLAVIINYSALAAEELAPQSEVRQDVEEIQNAAERAAALTQQLLTFSRREPPKPEILSLKPILDAVDDLLRGILGDDIELISSVASDLWPIEVNGDELEGMLLNFAVNASDAMPNGGVLRFGTENLALDAAQAARLPGALSPGRYILLAVSDTGCGMSKEVLARAFDPFFTTKSPGDGTGLGLAIVHGVVSAAGGAVDIDSAPGEGTTVSVYLPAAAMGGTEKRDGTVARARGRTVLLVEDEEPMRALVARVLSRAGYRVLEMTGPEEAVRELERLEEPVDLLLTDLVMPGISGAELANRLVERQPGLNVLLMSGYADDVLAAHALPADGPPLLCKPFSPDELLSSVAGALAATRDVHVTRRSASTPAATSQQTEPAAPAFTGLE